MTAAAPATRSILSLALVVMALVALSLLVPFAVFVAAPALLLVGARTLGSSTDADARTLGWLALLAGTLLLVAVVAVAVGAMAVTSGASVEVGGAVQVQPADTP